jgi:hypothetical protein
MSFPGTFFPGTFLTGTLTNTALITAATSYAVDIDPRNNHGSAHVQLRGWSHLIYLPVVLRGDGKPLPPPPR